MKATVIIPTYNEIENLPILIKGILSLDEPPDIIVVDDNSPDGTGQLADELAKNNASISVIHRPGKAGLGTAHLAGFAAVIDDSDLILTMDADLSHDPRHIPALIAKTGEGYDVVIGSRYVKGGSVDFNMRRRALSYGGNLFAAAILGLRTRDNTSGFRCYRRDALAKVLENEFTADGYSFLIEILYRAKQAGLLLGETPIQYADRRYGETKISQSEITKALRTVIRMRRGVVKR
jgi:dolichol-phosphate mannosyltransferase